MSVVALGDPYFVTALRVAGVEGRIVLTAKEAEYIVDVLIRERKCKVIILSEKLAILIERKRNELAKLGNYYPVFVVVPGLDGTIEEGRTRRLYQLISQAVGAKLKLGED